MSDYNPSIPQGSDNLSTSQGQILNNFTQLNNIFAFDHYAWNDNTTANRGLHRKVTFPAPVTISAPTGTASTFYSKLVSAVAAPYFDTAAGSNCVWYGGSSTGLVSATTGGTYSNGLITLPNGIIFQWGFQNNVSNGQTITFPSAFPNNCFNISMTGMRSNNDSRSLWINPSFSTTSFTVQTNSGSGLNVMYLAIGN